MYTHSVFIYSRRLVYRRGAVAFHDELTRAADADDLTTSAHYAIMWEASKLTITSYRNGRYPVPVEQLFAFLIAAR